MPDCFVSSLFGGNACATEAYTLLIDRQRRAIVVLFVFCRTYGLLLPCFFGQGDDYTSPLLFLWERIHFLYCFFFLLLRLRCCTLLVFTITATVHLRRRVCYDVSKSFTTIGRTEGGGNGCATGNVFFSAAQRVVVVVVVVVPKTA